ncbi:membrane protein [Clostridium folliculivorans]|uniref:Membrane protein n=1 Tax=Clostridium folliculivorans TaxID=2886038 RepID=A0A9W6DCG3_9CLOT|nr:O-antigen ligase family protein [Clostridium folliculivorans]GKU27284.1 membrane protein [Clostridium folliculivorans]
MININKNITKNIRNLLVIFVVFFINLIELFALNTGYFGRISFIVICFSGFLYFLYKNFIKNRGNRNRTLEVYTVLNIIFFLYVVANGVLFHNNIRLFYGGYQYIVYYLIFFTLYSFVEIRLLDIFMKFILGINFISSCIMIYEFITKKNIIETEGTKMAFNGVTIVRAKAFFGSFLNAGVVLCICCFIALYYVYRYRKQFKYIVLYSIIILVYLLGIFATGSRGPLVALIGGLFFYLIAYLILIKKDVKLTIIIVSTLAILSFLTLFIIMNINYESIDNTLLKFIAHRIQSIFNWSNDVGNVGRIDAWKNALKMVKGNITFGIGIAATGAKGIGSFSIGVTESGVLKKLVEMGIVGFIISYAIYIYVGISAFKNITSKIYPRETKIFNLFMLSAFISVMIEDSIYQSTESEVVSFYLFLVIYFIFVSKSKYFNKRFIDTSEEE